MIKARSIYRVLSLPSNQEETLVTDSNVLIENLKESH